MAALSDDAKELRLRLCAHARRIRRERKLTQRVFAKRMGTDEGHVSSLLNFKEDFGLDSAVRMHVAFKESLNLLCEEDPVDIEDYPPSAMVAERYGPERLKWWPYADKRKPTEEPSKSNPSHASPPVQSGRR